MEYFESDIPSSGDGLCSDNNCPCPEVKIPREEGYLYITQELVDQRRQHPTLISAKLAMQQAHKNIQAQFGPTTVSYRLGPILVCERGAKLRKLDLRIAQEDALRWWLTGEVPLRATPIKTAETKIFKGHSVEEAKALASKEIPEDSIDKIVVVSDVTESKQSRLGMNSEEEIKKLKNEIPKEAFDIGNPWVEGEEKEGTTDVKLPKAKADQLHRYNSWRHYVPKLSEEASLSKITCIVPEKKFLGFAFKPGEWRIHWKTWIHACVSYKMPAEVEVYLKPKT